MNEDQIKTQMQRVVDMLTTDIASIRTGRVAPALVEGLSLMVYGGTQRLILREIASITAPDPQMLLIDPWDKSIIGDIRKGIQEANIGLNPTIDGQVIRIVFPPMTTEDREKYVKILSTKLENARVQIRQIRGDGMHAIKRDFEEKAITEDEKRLQEKRVQELTDEYIGKVETVGDNKKKELMQWG
jgi:ribosome recycling factor